MSSFLRFRAQTVHQWYLTGMAALKKATSKRKLNVIHLKSKFNEFGAFSSIIQDVSCPTLIKLSLTRRKLHVNIVTFDHPVFLHLAQILKQFCMKTEKHRSVLITIFLIPEKKNHIREYCDGSVVYLASRQRDFHRGREFAPRDYKICVRDDRVLRRAGENKLTKSLISGVEMKAFLSEKMFVLPVGTCEEPLGRM